MSNLLTELKKDSLESVGTAAVFAVAEKLVEGTSLFSEGCLKRAAVCGGCDLVANQIEDRVAGMLPSNLQSLANISLKPALCGALYVGVNTALDLDFRSKTRQFIHSGVASAISRYGAPSLQAIMWSR